MQINKSTLAKIKAYILETQAKSTYNSAPHHPLEMCYNLKKCEGWNLGNCYKYANRYLATDGEKAGHTKDLFKVCHYAYLQYVRVILNYYNSLDNYIIKINDPSNIDNLFGTIGFVNPDTIADFRNDDSQISGKFWHFSKYLKLALLLIQQYENEHIDLETT